MPHKRSLKARQRRAVDRIVGQGSFKDREKQESVNTLTPQEIFYALKEQFGVVVQSLQFSYTDGEVLADSRAQGTTQQRAIVKEVRL